MQSQLQRLPKDLPSLSIGGALNQDKSQISKDRRNHDLITILFKDGHAVAKQGLRTFEISPGELQQPKVVESISNSPTVTELTGCLQTFIQKSLGFGESAQPKRGSPKPGLVNGNAA